MRPTSVIQSYEYESGVGILKTRSFYGAYYVLSFLFYCTIIVHKFLFRVDNPKKCKDLSEIEVAFALVPNDTIRLHYNGTDNMWKK